MQVAQQAEKIRAAILVILGTQQGERLMRPTFGSNLKRLVFAPNDAATANLARHYVEESLTLWEPRIQVDAVDIENDNQQACLLIHILYRIKATDEMQTLRYPLYLQPVYKEGKPHGQG